MNKKTLQHLLPLVLFTSPIIAILAITPIFILNTNRVLSFWQIWFIFSIGTLLSWLVQIILFSFFKKKGYSNLSYGITLTLIIVFILLATNNRFYQRAPGMQDYSLSNIILFRSSLLTSLNLIVFLFLDLIYTREKRVQLVKENAVLQYQKLETEYQLLKDQINPHFLFNALNISKSLIKTQPQEAEKYIIGLSEFLRKSLNNQHKAISLKQELAHCHQYIALQKVRFKEAINYQLNIGENHLDKQLPFFTLITLVENAIKHNSCSTEEPLEINIEVIDDFLIVKNNIKPKTGVVSTYTGLSSLNQRSKMVSGNEIEITNDGQYFSVKKN